MSTNYYLVCEQHRVRSQTIGGRSFPRRWWSEDGIALADFLADHANCDDPREPYLVSEHHWAADEYPSMERSESDELCGATEVNDQAGSGAWTRMVRVSVVPVADLDRDPLIEAARQARAMLLWHRKYVPFAERGPLDRAVQRLGVELGNVVVVDLCPECARPVGSWHVADCAAMRPDGTQGARVEPSRDAVLREGEKRS